MPILRDLMLKTNQTCNLGVLEGTKGVYLAKIEGGQAVTHGRARESLFTARPWVKFCWPGGTKRASMKFSIKPR